MATDQYGSLFLSKSCRPFDEHPFSFHPRKHVTNLYDLLECIDIDTDIRRSEILARKVKENTIRNSTIFISIASLSSFGSLVRGNKKYDFVLYNESLYSKFKPESELAIFGGYIYNKGYEKTILEIIEKLKQFSSESSIFYEKFNKENVEKLKNKEYSFILDDDEKADILISMYSKSRVHFVYGAAGTGKTTLINHICSLMNDKRKIFLAKTNLAIENLKRKVLFLMIMMILLQ